MASKITLKRGAALVLMAQFQEDDGSAADVSGLTISSQVRDREYGLVATLPMFDTGYVGLKRIELLDTSGWPTGTLLCDLRVLAGERVVLTETFPITVTKGITVDDEGDLPPFAGYPDSPDGLAPGQMYWNGNLLARVPLA